LLFKSILIFKICKTASLSDEVSSSLVTQQIP
jgi:hypothetical protein